jgi:triacylglycerol lipase
VNDTQESWRGRPLAETRWMLEASRLLVDPVFSGRGVPHGDGRPVLLMPGFLGGDQTLLALAWWLRRTGYRPKLCGFLANVNCSDTNTDKVERRLERAAAESGRRVALVGHSRGGHYVKALATRRPELVSHGISLGTGLSDMLDINSVTRKAVESVRATLQKTGKARGVKCFTAGCPCCFGRDFRAPFPNDAVHFTSIYSKGDGVVRWQSQVVPGIDCVEVTGSHVGLVFNRKSYRAIAVALAKPELQSDPVLGPAPPDDSRTSASRRVS